MGHRMKKPDVTLASLARKSVYFRLAKKKVRFSNHSDNNVKEHL